MKLYSAATPDTLSWPTDIRIERHELEGKAIIIHWSNARQSRFHPLWLRDNCACDGCLHAVSREHIFDIKDVPADIQASEIRLDKGGNLEIKWNHEQHYSRFNTGWLYAHSGLVPEPRQALSVWTSDDLNEPISFEVDGPDVSDAQLNDVLETVAEYGLARLRGVGSERDTLESLALRVGPIRETQFARVFDVISRPNDTDSNAYTNEALSSHTDIPTRESPPGLQLLHCLIADARGGESTMVDGFKVAHDLKTLFPEDYQNLVTTNWCYASRAGDSDYRWTAPVIGLDSSGEVSELRLLPFSRAPLMTEYDNIEVSYRALQRFMRMANASEYQIRYPFRAGDLVIFDNRRILHGRTEFYPQTGERALRGVYLDRDDMHSFLRRYRNTKNRQG